MIPSKDAQSFPSPLWAGGGGEGNLDCNCSGFPPSLTLKGGGNLPLIEG